MGGVARALDFYRLSFAEAFETVVSTIRNELGLELTGRRAKLTSSIGDKLRRESIRLTQMQDIAGCRLIVPDLTQQDSVVQSLNRLFESVSIIDRRKQPSHGYRAVHVIVDYRGKKIEIQIRTSLQHLWAEASEKFSDEIDPAIKYGGGDKRLQELLMSISVLVAEHEHLEYQFADLIVELSMNAAELSPLMDGRVTEEVRNQLIVIQNSLGKIIATLQKKMDRQRQDVSNFLREAVEAAKTLKEERK